MGANDASGQGLQSALKIRRQTNVLRKLWASEVLNIKPIDNNRQFPYEIYYHSIEKSHTTVVYTKLATQLTAGKRVRVFAGNGSGYT
jgi:hypothetical protein